SIVRSACDEKMRST
ncbi:hypothetical protein AB1N83_003384, partial [Pleurotus pulmonarius]